MLLFALCFSLSLQASETCAKTLYESHFAQGHSSGVESCSLSNSMNFYTKLMQNSISTEQTRIIILLKKSSSSRFVRISADSNYSNCNCAKKQLWHAFVLKNKLAFDPCYTNSPEKLEKYLNKFWNTSEKNYDLYSVQLKDIPMLNKLRKTDNMPALLDLKPVSSGYLIDNPLHISVKR